MKFKEVGGVRTYILYRENETFTTIRSFTCNWTRLTGYLGNFYLGIENSLKFIETNYYT